MVQTFQVLVAQLRKNAGGGQEPRAVKALRAEQRTWAAERERTCQARAAATKGTLWGVQRMPCFWQLSREREAKLRARLQQSRDLAR